MKVIKRDGTEVPFDASKITGAIKAASREVSGSDSPSDSQIEDAAGYITRRCSSIGRAVSVEEIQDMVEEELLARGYGRLVMAYNTYRWKHAADRKGNTTDSKILSLLAGRNEVAKQENSNKNPIINSTMRDYLAGETSRDISMRLLLPKSVVEAHEAGILHVHDLDYFAQHMYNCCLCNLEDMLQNGTVISGTMIEKPRSFQTACTVATQIVAQVSSNQFGGQSITLSHLAPFVDVSRKKIRGQVCRELCAAGMGLEPAADAVERITEERLALEIKAGIQTIQYQVQTLLSTNGQAPFLTIFMYLDEVPEGRTREDLALIIKETLEQRFQGVKNEKGVYISPAFPKLIYVLDEDNIHEESEYWHLTELAAKCTAKRMVPDYISAKIMKQLKNGDVYPVMGCRSALTPDTVGMNPDGSHKYYGRFNCGVVTINLVDVACSSEGDVERFWELMEERTELCKEALMCRFGQLLGQTSDVAPILWQYGAIARLEKGEKIDRLLYDNYCTISLGYAGLAECVYRMKGCSHTTPEGKDFGLKVMRFLNAKCSAWREQTNISFSLYGSPIETVTYRFAQCLQRRFGKIEGVTDHNYVTNSYHIPVTEEIDAFSKLTFESEFQELSPGGAISYVEVPNMQNNISGILEIMKHIYDNIMYAELNTKSDYCQACGYDGEIMIVEDDGKFVWECPQCGNRDERKMNVCRRVCGYLSTNFFNQGRTQEIKNRVLHVARTVDFGERP